MREKVEDVEEKGTAMSEQEITMAPLFTPGL